MQYFQSQLTFYGGKCGISPIMKLDVFWEKVETSRLSLKAIRTPFGSRFDKTFGWSDLWDMVKLYGMTGSRLRYGLPALCSAHAENSADFFVSANAGASAESHTPY